MLRMLWPSSEARYRVTYFRKECLMLQEVTCVKLIHQPLYDLDELNPRTPSFNLKHLGKFLVVIIKMHGKVCAITTRVAVMGNLNL